MRIAIIENGICVNIVVADSIDDISFISGDKIESETAYKGWIIQDDGTLIDPSTTDLSVDPLLCANCGTALDDTGLCPNCGYQL